MARGNRAHCERLLEAIETKDAKRWNEWRKSHPALCPDLRGIEIDGAELGDINLAHARLSDEASLRSIRAWGTNFAGADLRDAYLEMASLQYADLRGARLDRARLVAANLTMIKAGRASFRGANLSHAVLNGATLYGADLTGARVTGTSAWGIKVNAETRQENLRVDQWVDPLEDVSDDRDAAIPNVVARVNDLETAHLIYLIRDRTKFRSTLDAMIERVVLILGNFSARRKSVLTTVEVVLARNGYIPVVFDFERPRHRDLIDTVALIAGFSRFVIADLTKPRSTPLESMLIVPHLMVPFASIIQQDEEAFSMFGSLREKYDWVLDTWRYRSQGHLQRNLKKAIIEPCEAKLAELDERRGLSNREE